MKQKLILAIALLFLTGTLLPAQSRVSIKGNRWIPSLERGRLGIGFLGSPFSLFGGAFFRGGGPVGLFGSSRSFKEKRFAGQRGRTFFGWSSWTPWVSSVYAWRAWQKEPSTSARFVEQWKDRETFPEEAWSDLTESRRLSEGMTGEEVALAVGTPLERSPVGTKQVWKYSSFSLLFQSGRLKWIR